MIKLPKEVNEIIGKLNEKGFPTFVVGGSLRDSLLGMKPVDWDLTTKARLEDIKEIFPKCKILNEKLGVVRMDFTKSEDDYKSPIVDVATFRKELSHDEKGRPVKFTFVDTVEEDLKRRDFTVNAIAASPQKGIIDVFNGREDVKNKVVRCVGEAERRIKEDPIRILRAIKLVSEKGFSLDEELYNAIKNNYRLLENASPDRIREEFIRIMGGTAVGEGVKILKETGVLKIIAGDNADSFFFRKKALYLRFVRKINDTYPIAERRLGLFYSLLGGKTGVEAIEKLNYSKDMKIHLLDAVVNMSPLGTIKKPVELKGFIAEVGMKRYQYMDEIAQDKVVVYGGSPRRINKRLNMLNSIREKNEAVTVDDLIIDGNDIKEELGIDGKIIGEILNCLILDIHRKPFKNHRDGLLAMAKEYKNSSLKRAIRQNKWLNRLR